MSFYHNRHLSCPVVRKATPQDAMEMAELVINSNSKFVESVFDGNYVDGFKVLTLQFTQHNDGLYVLTEAERIIGIMKLHLPDLLFGSTISYKQLVEILGMRKGIRAGVLLSHWDEYKLKPNEAYIEYLYVHVDWEHFDVSEILLEHAYELAYQAGATYITRFLPILESRVVNNYEDNGYVVRKRKYSPLAKLMGAEHSSWYRATYKLANKPITVKEYVADKLDNVRTILYDRRREIFAAIRLTLALTVIPLVAGSLAYIRGFPWAAGAWGLIAMAHLLGVKLYLSGSVYGRYGLIIAIFAEGINLFSRSIATPNWFDRSWLLPLSLLTFWIVSVLIRNPSDKIQLQISTA